MEYHHYSNAYRKRITHFSTNLYYNKSRFYIEMKCTKFGYKYIISDTGSH